MKLHDTNVTSTPEICPVGMRERHEASMT